MTSFAAAAVRHAGLAARQLGWRPDEFWRATPSEYCTALAPADDAAAMSAAELDRLRQRFPDGD